MMEEVGLEATVALVSVSKCVCVYVYIFGFFTVAEN